MWAWRWRGSGQGRVTSLRHTTPHRCGQHLPRGRCPPPTHLHQPARRRVPPSPHSWWPRPPSLRRGRNMPPRRRRAGCTSGYDGRGGTRTAGRHCPARKHLPAARTTGRRRQPVRVGRLAAWATPVAAAGVAANIPPPQPPQQPPLPLPPHPPPSSLSRPGQLEHRGPSVAGAAGSGHDYGSGARVDGDEREEVDGERTCARAGRRSCGMHRGGWRPLRRVLVDG